MAQITFKLPERIVFWPDIPKEKPRGSDEMYAKLICHPPLGQPTVIPAGQDSVDFTILLETDPASERQWEVALWHDLGGQNGQWSSLNFDESIGEHEMVGESPC